MHLENDRDIPDGKSQVYGAIAGLVVGTVFLLFKSGVPAHTDDFGSFGLGLIAFAFGGAVILSFVTAFRDMRS